MLNGITFYTDDKIWAGILSDLNAAAMGKDIADIVFVPVSGPVSVIELKSQIIKHIDGERDAAMRAIGTDLDLPENIIKIITLLSRAGTDGISGDSLKIAIGYAPDAISHALDTTIYNIRKMFGQDFIKTDKGRYFIGV